MRRSASEIIRNLETRIARLERSATTKKEAENVLSLENRLNNAYSDYASDVRNEMFRIIQAEGVMQYKPRSTNTVIIGPPNQPVTMALTRGEYGTLKVVFFEQGKIVKTFNTKKLLKKSPKEAALLIWNNIPPKFKTPKR